MDWPYRLVGLVVFLGLTVFTLVLGVAQLVDITDGEQAQAADDLVTKPQATMGKAGPAQLAFTEGGFAAGTHRIRPNDSLFQDESNEDTDTDTDTDENQNEETDAVDLPEPSGPHSGGLDPGLYTTTFDAKDCSYRLVSSGDVPFDYLYEPDPYDPEDYNGRRVGRNDEITTTIGEDHLHGGRVLVSILGVESNTFTSSVGCGQWMPWTPVLEPLTTITDGDYWTSDLVRGEWSVPPGCLWEKVVAFRGGRLEDVVAGDRGPGSVMIDEGTTGLRIRQCQGQSLIRIGDADPYVPYTHPGPAEELTDER